MNASIDYYVSSRPTMRNSQSFSLKSETEINGRPIRNGDIIFVRLVSSRCACNTIAEFTLKDVSDLTDIYGEIRRHTKGLQGLVRLYIRNVTRGWSFQKPFKLYGNTVRMATSLTHQVKQPESVRQTGRRQIPESIRLLFGDH